LLDAICMQLLVKAAKNRKRCAILHDLESST
jgi:hypothetical protein